MQERDQHITLSVIIPAYNEAERIGSTLAEVGAYLEKQDYPSEVLVVDDGSKDDTRDVVDAHARKRENLRRVSHATNQGKGWAVRTGALHARGRYRLFMDADGSTSISHWDALKDAFARGADVVVGSRHTDGSRIIVSQAPHRELTGWAFRRLVQALFGLQVNDTQNGFKAFTARAAEDIFSRQRVRGWAFDVEILALADALGYGIAEVPIKWVNDDRTRLTFLSMPQMLLDVFKIKWAMAPTLQPRPRQTLAWERGQG
jgi:glycosyltransferase involved in cell wall biosynthesis